MSCSRRHGRNTQPPSHISTRDLRHTALVHLQHCHQAILMLLRKFQQQPHLISICLRRGSPCNFITTGHLSQVGGRHACRCPWRSCRARKCSSASIRSQRVSPMPIRIPLVKGTLAMPAASIVASRSAGSCGQLASGCGCFITGPLLPDLCPCASAVVGPLQRLWMSQAQRFYAKC